MIHDADDKTFVDMSYNEIAVNLLNAKAGDDDFKILFSAIQRRVLTFHENLQKAVSTIELEVSNAMLTVASFHLVLKVT